MKEDCLKDVNNNTRPRVWKLYFSGMASLHLSGVREDSSRTHFQCHLWMFRLRVWGGKNFLWKTENRKAFLIQGLKGNMFSFWKELPCEGWWPQSCRVNEHSAPHVQRAGDMQELHQAGHITPRKLTNPEDSHCSHMVSIRTFWWSGRGECDSSLMRCGNGWMKKSLVREKKVDEFL